MDGERAADGCAEMARGRGKWPMLRRAVSMDGENGDPFNIESTMTPRQHELIKSGRSAAAKAGPRVKSKLAATKATRRKGAGPMKLSLNAYGRLGVQADAPVGKRAIPPGMSRSVDSDLLPQPPGTGGDDSGASRLFNPLGHAISKERATESPRARKVKLKLIKKQPTSMTKSLDDKLLDYEDNRKELDRLSAATGVRRDSLTDVAKIAVGERCEVFCPKADTWVSGDVVEADGTRVHVRYLSHSNVEGTTDDGSAQTEARWVDQTSSEFRRGISDATSPRPGILDSLSSDYVREHSACFRRLSLNEKRRGFQSLAACFHERTPASMMELAAWTYSSDLFTGLNEKQRREICLNAEREEADEYESLIAVGEIGSRILVVLEGTCAIYTMRGIKSQETGFQEEEEDKDQVGEKSRVDLREKYAVQKTCCAIMQNFGSCFVSICVKETDIRSTDQVSEYAASRLGRSSDRLGRSPSRDQ
eukprot:COSAG06_NODE_775_length_12397_cov_15.034071_11_plen_477_part_00